MSLFRQALNSNSDIQQHLGLLHGLAIQSAHVVEIGFRTGVSTSAFCAAGCRVTSYDILPCEPHLSRFKKVHPDLEFIRADSRKVTIPKCNLLFIDGEHTYKTVRAELMRHGQRANPWIALHDTETFGRKGKDGSKPGLRQAIDEFLAENENWSLHLHLPNNNGLTLLARVN